MIEIGLVWLLIGGELLLVLAVALAALLIFGAVRRRRDREAAMHLIQAVKKGESQRKEKTSQWLQQQHGLSGEALNRNVHDMVQAEKLLIQRVVNMYVKRDRISLRELNIDVEAVSEPFRKLEGTGAAAASGEADEAQAGGDDGALKAENESLKQELQITMDTMSRMLSEYASMFGTAQPGGAPAPAAQDAAETEPEESADEPLGAELNDDLEGLAELEDPFESLDDPGQDIEDMGKGLPDVEIPADEPATAVSDETVQIDLADDEIADLFGAEDEFPLEEEQKEVQTDAEGNVMDEDLANMWADALGEQDNNGKS